jgi:hypothetical protein
MRSDDEARERRRDAVEGGLASGQFDEKDRAD